MPIGIDLPACANLWTEQERTLFNKLDFYLAKTQVEYFQHWTTWQKLLKPIPWQPNMGPVMRGVRKVPTPIIRSEFLPNPISQMSAKDVIDVRETVEQVQLYKHFFDSDIFQFLPSFQDFLTDHVDYTNSQIVEKMAVAQDLFLRTAIFHGSPMVWVAGNKDNTGELVNAPYWLGYTIAKSKTAAFLKDMVAKVQSNLSLKQITKLAVVAEQDIAMPYYSGSILGDGSDGEGLKGKYCLLTSTEAWSNFNFDEHVLANRKLDLDVVTKGFTGEIQGRITAKFERYPIRIAADGTIPVPEMRVDSATAAQKTAQSAPYNEGDTVINPAYKTAPFEVAFLMGAEGYKSIRIGPPPSDFAKPTMSVEKFKGMDWSGKVELTQNFMIQCLDASGTVVTDTNKRREYLQLISAAVMGILPINRRCVIPIIFARQRVGANV